MNLERLGAMVRKEFVQMRRDPTTLRLMLAVPVMQLLIFGFAVRTDVRNLPTVIFDQSRSQESRAFVQALVATDNFVVGRTSTPTPRRSRRWTPGARARRWCSRRTTRGA